MAARIDRLEAIRAFLAVADTGSFTKAALKLQLSVNAVSLRVRALERSLEVQLLLRSTRSVSLTDEGREYQKRTSALIDDLDAAETEIRLRGSRIQGTVRIGLPPAVATESFFRQLGRSMRKHPGLKIQTRITNTAVMPTSDGLDIAVFVGRPPDSRYVARALGSVHWVLAAAPGYLKEFGSPSDPEQLEQHVCLRLLANPPQDEWILVNRQGKATQVSVRGGLEIDDSRALGDATYAGVGIGVRPAGEVAHAERQRRLARVLPEYRFQATDLHALLSPGRIRLPRIALCLQFLVRAVEEIS